MNAIDELHSIERCADAIMAEVQALRRCAVAAREKVEQAVSCLAGQVRDPRDGGTPSGSAAGNLGPKMRAVMAAHRRAFGFPPPDLDWVVTDAGGRHEVERIIADLDPVAAWQALYAAATRKKRETGEPS